MTSFSISALETTGPSSNMNLTDHVVLFGGDLWRQNQELHPISYAPGSVGLRILGLFFGRIDVSS